LCNTARKFAHAKYPKINNSFPRHENKPHNIMATTKQKLIGLCTSIKTLERLITQLKEDAIKLKQDIKEETTAKVVQEDVKLAVYRKRKTGT
jgi:archaellum component FlaC